MFFVRLAQVIAVLLLMFGAARVGIGLYVASLEPREVREAARERYIGRKTSGQAIDQGIYVILFSVTLGTLAAIAKRKVA